MANDTLMVVFVITALIFLIISFVVGWFIRSSAKDRKTAIQELEATKHKLKQEQQKLINELEQNKFKKQAEQLAELYKDLRSDIAEIKRKIQRIKGQD